MSNEDAAVSYEIDASGIAHLVFDLPGEKVNKLSISVMEELDGLLARLEKEAGLRGVVVASNKDNIFIAGADISEIEGVSDPKKGRDLAVRGQQVLGRLEGLPVPVVAAIDGAALGGGMELALACHYRVVTNNPKAVMGLPEVKLGIHPGFGGTQRLPRLISLRSSLDMILTGKNIYPKKALRLGLADKMVPAKYLKTEAMEIIDRVYSENYRRPVGLRKKPSISDRLIEGTSIGRNLVFKKAKEALLEKTRGKYPATIKALQVIQEGLSLHLEGGLAIEASSLGEMAVTEECKNLISVFYLQEELKKSTGVKGKIIPKGIESAVVLGAGVMGGGIAQLFADKGLPVRMKDIAMESLGSGLKAASKVFESALKRKRIDRRQFAQRMGNISTTLDYSGFGNADIVVEAVVEKMAVKKAVLKECEGFLKRDATLTSNTSSLSITDMAEGLKRPESFAGMHFFNPVHRMPLVEVIRGKKTSDKTTASIVALSKKLGKVPIVVNDKEGFLVNRLLMPYLNEAVLMIEEGLSIEAIDDALLDFGMPMGALILLDEIGLDVGHHVAEILHKAFGERMKPAALMQEVLDSGRLGRKNAKGYYAYASGKRGAPDKAIYSLMPERGGRLCPAEEIIDRCILLMVNEAAFCLEEKIVSGVMEIDGGMIFGTGFPPFRGGLLRYADRIGIQEVVAKLEELQEKHGERFKPAKLLKKMEKSGKGFY